MKDCQILYETKSVCPVCLKKIPAVRVLVGKEVFLRKSCDEHGSFSSIIWRGYYQIEKWIPESDNISVENALCPDKCGLCPDHLQKTCCVLLDITGKCNLSCGFCLANQCDGGEDPSFEEICNSLSEVIDRGKSLVQLSGGEPTTRDALPDIIRYAKDAGAKYVQLNSNGIRLGTEPDYAEKLAQAGLSFVFMQFDGTDDWIFRKLRNRPLLEIKKQAIENCAKFNIGVTLVPTMVRDVNMDNIGEMIRFAISQSPKVRGLHFQPVSYLGRIPKLPDDRNRITLDELVYEIEKQSDSMIKAADLLPSCCDHALCGFHGDFVADRGRLVPLSRRSAPADTCCCSGYLQKKTANSYFDGVFMECSFSLMENQADVLREIKRVLKPAGFLVISDLFAHREPAQLSGGLGRIDKKETIISSIENMGFQIMLFEDFTDSLRVLWGQMIFEKGAESFYCELGVSPEVLKRVRCGYFLMAAQKSSLL